MNVRWIIMGVLIGLPILASAVIMLTGVDMPERHHLHHDTYSVSPVISRSFMLVMLFMGMLGVLTGWLCHLGVFKSDPLIPFAFFASFLAMLTVILALVLVYRVTVYDDYLVVRRAFRPTRTIRYRDIKAMEWVPSRLDPRLHDLYIVSRNQRDLRILCLLDIEQMLLRIDRFDAFGK